MTPKKKDSPLAIVKALAFPDIHRCRYAHEKGVDCWDCTVASVMRRARRYLLAERKKRT